MAKKRGYGGTLDSEEPSNPNRGTVYEMSFEQDSRNGQYQMKSNKVQGSRSLPRLSGLGGSQARPESEDEVDSPRVAKAKQRINIAEIRKEAKANGYRRLTLEMRKVSL
jgi:hypothetical protein